MPRHSNENTSDHSGLSQSHQQKRKFLSISEPVFLQKKFEDHRSYTATILFLYSVFGICAWLMDYASDPVLAEKTFGLRFASLVFIAGAMAIRRVRSYKQASLIVFGCIFLDLMLNLLIIRRLNGELPGGVALFAYFPMGATLACLGLSVRLSLSCTLLMAAIPPISALFHGVPQLPYALYAAVIGPEVAGLAILTCAFAWNYHQRFILERALEEASNTDALTGVANRRHFNVVMRRELSRSERLTHQCALLMLDIDHFKKINDTYGHPTGDRVICALAEICTTLTRDADWVARLGGEEFAILLPETSLDQAFLLAERIRTEVQQHHITSVDGAKLQWTISIGVVSARPDGHQHSLKECERMISQGDTALYAAKNNGRNCVVCHQEDAATVL
ncbi:GGDEF domain-containing protein [Pseudomonas sp. TH49]|uniref:GGDEF domain-containing protein n=1 Tax=Pseudomonas sp. TH49 TaxID=2796413 RepID=UPI00191423B6|nr:GGDEF domain-containing protein [Pseudomonas sp. TH49]MBK5344644.1 GGDEF domain-containing protein [Pseudomonas sp. TH49]